MGLTSLTMKWKRFTRNGYQIHAAIPDEFCTLYCTYCYKEKLYRVQAEIEYEVEDICMEKSLGKAKAKAEKWYEEFSQNWLNQ